MAIVHQEYYFDGFWLTFIPLIHCTLSLEVIDNLSGKLIRPYRIFTIKENGNMITKVTCSYIQARHK